MIIFVKGTCTSIFGCTANDNVKFYFSVSFGIYTVPHQSDEKLVNILVKLKHFMIM